MCVHNKPQNPLSTQVVTEPVDRALSTTMEPEAPVLAVYLPILRLHIVSNTFIRYLNAATGTERVGLVLSVRPDKRVLRVREFLTWPEVKARYPDLPRSFSCWPQDTRHPPKFLCDSDLTSEISVAHVRSLAFVFYDTDVRLRRLIGVRNTFRVSSFYSSQENKIFHRCSFEPFPSSRFRYVLPSCFPSTLFQQMRTIQGAIQRLVNTRSLRESLFKSATLQNVDYFTWRYISSFSTYFQSP